MGQLDIFGENDEEIYLPYELIEYYPDFFSKDESDFFLKKLIADTPWEQRVLKIYNK